MPRPRFGFVDFLEFLEFFVLNPMSFLTKFFLPLKKKLIEIFYHVKQKKMIDLNNKGKKILLMKTLSLIGRKKC